MSNLLHAVRALIQDSNILMMNAKANNNRINSMGDQLETYIKDLFSNALSDTDEQIKMQKYASTFSYTGNKNNPPDMMLIGGDAIEVKKIQTANANIALNSSYPKAKIFANSPMITKECKHCEDWIEKDLIYIIGHTDNKHIKYLWFIYGDCFVADQAIYERIKQTISSGINTIPDVEFAETNELGKVKKVDPLGITDLRIRGMWHIENPHKIFQYLNCTDHTAEFQMICLMTQEKFEKFPQQDQDFLTQLQQQHYSQRDVVIKNPNNPVQLIPSKLITFKVMPS